MQRILRQWRRSDSAETPNYYVACANYYMFVAARTVLYLDSKISQDTSSLLIEDTTGKPVGSLSYKTFYNPDSIEKALECLTEAISKYPNRLDLRFGKIYLFERTENWKSMYNEIMKTLDYSVENKNKWLWSGDKMIKHGKDVFLSGLQSYMFDMYNTENDSLLIYIKNISEKILKYYPLDLPALNNLGMYYFYKKQYEKAEKYFLKVLKLNKKDTLVLMNLAYLYEIEGKKEKAIKYYKKVLKYGKGQVIIQVKQILKKLQSD